MDINSLVCNELCVYVSLNFFYKIYSSHFVLELAKKLLVYILLLWGYGYLSILSVSIFILKLAKKLLAYSAARNHDFVFLNCP